MKIGIDATCWANRRGYGRFTRQLIRALLQADAAHEYIFFLDAASATSFQPAGIYRKVQVDTSKAVTDAARAGGFRSPGDILKMSLAVFQESLDWFYFPSVYSYFPVWNPCRIAITIHDTIAESYPDHVFPTSRDRLFWKSKVRLACLQSDLVFTVSELSLAMIQKEYEVPESRFRLISEAPDSIFLREPGPAKMLPDQSYFIYVGGISPHKNLSGLIRAFADPEFQECRLLIVGDYSTDAFLTDFTELQAVVHETRTAKRVVFTGYLPDEDVVPLLRSSLALILPSFCEGFGLPAVEAMAAGAPVICTKHSAIPEVAPDAALLIDPNDIETLKRAMTEVKQDAALRDRLSNKGRQCVEKLSWHSSACSLLHSLENA